MNVRDTLTAARDLIADPARWTQGSYAKTKDGNTIGANCENAVCFCALGAVGRTLGMPGSAAEYTPAGLALRDATFALTGGESYVAYLNDGIVRVGDLTPHQAVLKVFDLAIERQPS